MKCSEYLNIKVEYDPTPIRHIAVQCPYCGRWFKGYDILISSNNNLAFSYDIKSAVFKCPVCTHAFGLREQENLILNIMDCSSSEEVYKDCLTKKVTWE